MGLGIEVFGDCPHHGGHRDFTDAGDRRPEKTNIAGGLRIPLRSTYLRRAAAFTAAC